LQPSGVAPVAPSAVRPDGNTMTASWKPQPFETPRHGVVFLGEQAEIVACRQGALKDNECLARRGDPEASREPRREHLALSAGSIQ
jgi:hypothetical protein